jgi:hypothetical protein
MIRNVLNSSAKEIKLVANPKSQNLRGNNRDTVRAPVVPIELLGILAFGDADNIQQLPFLVWDVSRNGLGLWKSSELKSNEKVTITLGKPYLLVVEGDVKWCSPTEEKGCFRVGIHIPDNNEQFSKLYEKFSKLGAQVEK